MQQPASPDGERVDSGFFYDVYDLGNGRVLKKKKPFRLIHKSMYGESKITKFVFSGKTCLHILRCKLATRKIRNRLDQIPGDLLGNPRFLNSVDYTQDKVLLLMDYFETHNLEENQKIVDQYIRLIETLLTYGVHDYVYKFKNSYGVNREGEVIFIDFNEVTFSKKKALEFVKKRQWESEAQYRKFPEGELKALFKRKFTETLTPEVINANWKEIRD